MGEDRAMPNDNRQVQDDSREVLITKLCGLRHNEDNRSNVNTADAFDEQNHPFELKSTTRSSVTTARDVNLTTLGSWRRKYWILAKGRNLTTSFVIDALYIAHPNQLEEFFARIEARLNTDWEFCRPVLKTAKDGGVEDDVLQRVESILHRGITLNNPKIPLRLFERATHLDHTDPQQAVLQRREFVRKNPLSL